MDEWDEPIVVAVAAAGDDDQSEHELGACALSSELHHGRHVNETCKTETRRSLKHYKTRRQRHFKNRSRDVDSFELFSHNYSGQVSQSPFRDR